MIYYKYYRHYIQFVISIISSTSLQMTIQKNYFKSVNAFLNAKMVLSKS